MWSQFLPTFLIWVAVVLYLSSALHDWQVANVLRFTVAYLIVPVVGLYFSLRSRFVLLSWLATLAACFALPQLFWWTCVLLVYGVLPGDGLGPDGRELSSRWFGIVLFQLILAACLLWRLRVNLARRSFSLR